MDPLKMLLQQALEVDKDLGEIVNQVDGGEEELDPSFEEQDIPEDDLSNNRSSFTLATNEVEKERSPNENNDISHEHYAFAAPIQKELTRHQMKHVVDQGEYLCQQCAKPFNTPQARRSHFIYHHGTPQNTCGDCGKVFVTKSQLQVHAIIHTGLRPFKCDLCSFDCNTKSGLRNHKMTHVKERPLKCPECTYSHHVWRSFYAHMNKHKGLRPYKCQECDYATCYKSNLTGHITAKHS